MNQINRRNIYTFLAIPVFLVLLSCEVLLSRENSHEKEQARVYHIFESKERSVEILMDSVSFRLNNNPKVLSDWSLLRFFQNHEQGLEVAVYSEKGLIFWSSSSIAFSAAENSSKKFKGLIHLPTGWYYQITQRLSLIHI